ncbi:uncharacterized protein LOC121868129 [Homarus americanus]|uniref:uncharacterized protein LOC121868129 n=1 Tax=Homarus americanus TaxID=6706 RepID=UPI001C4835B6|nr:uncharacterized protein LOC121868129 [Homarus americanus]
MQIQGKPRRRRRSPARTSVRYGDEECEQLPRLPLLSVIAVTNNQPLEHQSLRSSCLWQRQRDSGDDRVGRFVRGATSESRCISGFLDDRFSVFRTEMVMGRSHLMKHHFCVDQ